MLKNVNINTMKKFILNADPAYGKFYTLTKTEIIDRDRDARAEALEKELEKRLHEKAEMLVKTLDEKLDDVIYTYCKDGKEKDFSYTHENETFSILEIKAMRNCSYYDAVLLMDGFIKDPETGRMCIMRP